MKVLKPLIDELTKLIQEGYDLGKKEIPQVGRELLTYNFWREITYAIAEALVFILLEAGGIYFMMQAMAPNQDRFSDNGFYWIPAVLFILIGMVPGGCLLENLGNIMKIRLAPRVFLLDELKGYLE